MTMTTFQKFKLGDMVDFIDGDRGKQYPSQGEFYDSGFCLFLSTKNVPNTKFDFGEMMFITEEKDLELRKGKVSHLSKRVVVFSCGCYRGADWHRQTPQILE